MSFISTFIEVELTLAEKWPSKLHNLGLQVMKTEKNQSDLHVKTVTKTGILQVASLKYCGKNFQSSIYAS